MRLTDLVKPDHAAVSRLVARTSCHAGLPVERQIEVLRRELGGWRFESRLGPGDPDAVEAARAGNCVDLASLFCAALRRGGHRCYLLIGARAAAFPAIMHAWAVVRLPEPRSWLLVDPAGMRVRACQPDQIERELTVVALCDDHQVIMSAADRTALWRDDWRDDGAAAGTGGGAGQL